MAETIDTITQKLTDNAAATATLQETVDALQSGAADAFAALSAQIDELKAQIGAGTPISQEQLDALGAAADAQAAALAAITQDVADTPLPPVV